MANTYGELILEYENYQYSKENYEITKECYEIELMEQYLESQTFMEEYGSTMSFNESYFMEANDPEPLRVAVNEKKQNLFKRILNGLKKLWEKIKGFCKKVYEAINSKRNKDSFETLKSTLETMSSKSTNTKSDDNSKSSDNSKSTNKSTNTKSDDNSKSSDNRNENIAEELLKILKDGWKQEYIDAGYNIYKSVSGVTKNVGKKMNSNLRSIVDNLGVSFSNDKKELAINIVNMLKIVYPFALSIETGCTRISVASNIDILDFIELSNFIHELHEHTPKGLQDIYNDIDKAINEIHKSGIYIQVNPKRFNDNKFIEATDKYIKKILSDTLPNMSPEDVTLFINIYTKFQTCTANAMKLHGYIIQYQNTVIPQIDALCKKYSL